MLIMIVNLQLWCEPNFGYYMWHLDGAVRSMNINVSMTKISNLLGEFLENKPNKWVWNNHKNEASSKRYV